ncbi:DUF5069 domain-containing protein [Verrucomicrobiaceae bacterium N1E253]|uniref:DUF5069 domain-containing protein n=1 Tax=Oceaniferula marina TaxID=2748318 RepID=A0A851GPM0_9BACT|nr:DUF5069 domain-containing protein [Oceaniferula marina]NWK56770.1 DUF5069 domain-containing protein [Oceaniferula marina]
MNDYLPPASPREEIEGMVYFIRMCSKIRLQASGELHPDFHPNLGRAMDLWTCQLLQVEYETLKQLVVDGASDRDVLQWCWETGKRPSEHELEWWNSYMRNRGFRDDLSDKLQFRKEEAGWLDRDEIQSFFDYLDADDGRL